MYVCPSPATSISVRSYSACFCFSACVSSALGMFGGGLFGAGIFSPSFPAAAQVSSTSPVAELAADAVSTLLLGSSMSQTVPFSCFCSLMSCRRLRRSRSWPPCWLPRHRRPREPLLLRLERPRSPLLVARLLPRLLPRPLPPLQLRARRRCTRSCCPFWSVHTAVACRASL